MKNYHGIVFRKSVRAAIFAAASLPLIIGASAYAQQAATPTGGGEDKDKVQQLEKFVVTGSYIPAAADSANASPVTVLTAKEIELTGVTTSLLDVLRKGVPQIVGGNNIGKENGNTGSGSTNGGASLAVRNTATLVLIDGMRVVFDPVAGGGGVQFVDLNVVPVSAVERIEILTDGASAIYGSDAVGGVVNIILKKNYQGLEVGGHMGASKKDRGGYYHEREFHMVAGATMGKTNITVSAEWNKHDPLFERDFNYTSPVHLSASYPGVVNIGGSFFKLNPALNAPPVVAGRTMADLVALGIYVPTPLNDVVNGFDLSARPTFQQGNTKKIASFALEHAISDKVTFKSSFLYARTESSNNLNPQPIVFTVNSNASNTGLPGIPFTDRATVRNRFLGFPNRDYRNDTDAYRGTAILEGHINDDWNWTVTALYNQANQSAIATKQILQSALLAGIAAGQINLTAINQNPALVSAAGIFGDAFTLNESRLYAYDARISGKLFDVPAGSVFMAAGIGTRHEGLRSNSDANSIFNPATGTSAWNNGVSATPFDAVRNIDSAFFEIKVPIASPNNNIPGFNTLDLDGAIRHEKYSDNTEKPNVPKVTLRWLPFDDQFLIRATYSKSFAAPPLFSLFGPTNQGATPSLAGLTAFNAAGQAIGVFPAIQGQQQGGSNPNLTPSHSKNFTVGAIYSPKALKGLSISLDYFKINETDIIGALAATTTIVQSVEQFGTASPFANFVHIGNFGQLGGTRVTGAGQLHIDPSNVFVDQFPVNVGEQNQSGFDLTIKYGWQNSMGNWSFSTSATYLRSFIVISSPEVGPVEFADTNGFGTLPKLRSYSNLTWQKDAYTASVSGSWIRSVISAGDGSKLPSYTSVDMQFGADLGKISPMFKGLKMNVGINNVFNKFGPVDPNIFSDPPMDSGIYGALGRTFYVDATYKF